MHGFSGGAYVWGECMIKMEKDINLYQPILDRFRGQVWDSICDVQDFPYGMAYTVFPNNRIYSRMLHGIIL